MSINLFGRFMVERQSNFPYFDIYETALRVLVLSLRATDCDTDHYLVVANVRERLAVSKYITQFSY